MEKSEEELEAERQVKAFTQIKDACETLGWDLAFNPGEYETNDDEILHGLIIGEPAYVKYVVSELE